MERLGLAAARIHNVGAAREAKHRVTLSGDTLGRANLAFLESRKIIARRVEKRYLAAAHRIADVADARLRSTERHRIHGDLHHGNLLLRDGVLRVVDFDDMMIGPAVQDLWLLIPGRDAEARRHREIFLESYEQLRRFDRGSLRLVEPLRGLRLIHYAAWIARRFHDPIFPRTFVHFGTEAYWEEQARDLEEIVALVEAEDGAGGHDSSWDES